MADPASQREWALALFRRSVLNRRKLAELVRALGSTERLRCLDLGSDNGVVSLLLRERGGSWASGDLTREAVTSIRSLVDDDVHLVAGDDVLRQWLNGYVVQYRMFLRLMVISALGNRPPLGVVRDFVTNAEGNTLDLKLNGTTPFVDASRVIALYAGSGETGTVPRLRAIGKHWNLEPAEVEGWAESFLNIQMLRLRSHYEKLQRGEEMDNRIDPDGLNDLDRRILKEAFRQARKLQALMEKSFQF